MSEAIREECGLFGVYGSSSEVTAPMIYAGLYSLQHRGQESCGIAVNENREVKFVKEQGRVRDVMSEMLLSQLVGHMGIGHVRYGKAGTNANVNAQPLVSRYRKGPLAIAHNGQLSNDAALREELDEQGAFFQTTTDAEIILHKVTRERRTAHCLEDAIAAAMHGLRGAYSVLMMNANKLVAFRDPAGMRPLCLGKLGDIWMVSSETCAIDTVGGRYLRDIEPGEIVVIDENGLRSNKTHCGGDSHLCAFEYIYNARADSVIDGQSVYEARRNLGRILAQSHPVEADLVFGVPDSGLDAAAGYAMESGIPLGRGLVINRYIGRTFIQPGQNARNAAVRIKFNAIRTEIAGKRVVVVDDSIVRGTTTAHMVELLRNAGASQVHMRISSPPFLWPCYFGTDVPDRDSLIAANNTIEQIRQHMGADTLGFLPVERMRSAVPDAKVGLCDACFTGVYPVPLR